MLRCAARAVDDFGHGVEDVAQTDESRAAPLHDAEREAHRDHGPRHAREGTPEREESALRQTALGSSAQQEHGPVTEEHQDADGGDRTDRRAERTAEPGESKARPKVLL